LKTDPKIFFSILGMLLSSLFPYRHASFMLNIFGNTPLQRNKYSCKCMFVYKFAEEQKTKTNLMINDQLVFDKTEMYVLFE